MAAHRQSWMLPPCLAQQVLPSTHTQHSALSTEHCMSSRGAPCVLMLHAGRIIVTAYPPLLLANHNSFACSRLLADLQMRDI